MDEKEGDEETEDDFLSTNTEKLKDKFNQAALEDSPWCGCQMGGVGILGPNFLD